MHLCGTSFRGIGGELKAHAPFTVLGALTGVAAMALVVLTGIDRWSEELFESFHSLHVFFSALVTAGIYRLHSPGRPWATIVVGYIGSIGVATLSDCVIPYLGESLLGMHAHLHAGFIEAWWLVNPLAFAGIALALVWPRTKVPHALHVLLSTWASLFHMTMAMEGSLDAVTLIVSAVFLFLAVWVPCCTSDIVFPLLFIRKPEASSQEGDSSCRHVEEASACSRSSS